MAALLDFRNGLMRCWLLRDIENTFPDPPITTFDQHSVEALRASVAVLMVASFEDFVRQTFREHLDILSLAVSGFTLSSYHEHLRVESVLGGLNLAFYGPRGTRKKDVRDIKRQSSILAIVNAIARDEIIVEALSDVESNPNGSKIVKMLERIGIKSVNQALDKRYATRFRPCPSNFVSDRLNSIVSTRHIVAHSGRALTVSRLDLDTNLKLLDEAAQVIDMVLADFIVAAKGAASTAAKVKTLLI